MYILKLLQLMVAIIHINNPTDKIQVDTTQAKIQLIKVTNLTATSHINP